MRVMQAWHEVALSDVQAAGCADGIIKLWDVPGKRSLRKLVGHTGKGSEGSFMHN